MKFLNISKEAVCELLDYLAENEEFESVKNLKGFNRQDVREVLGEISKQLKSEVIEEVPHQRPHYPDYHLSPKAMALVSCLSPREEMLLFRSFKLL